MFVVTDIVEQEYLLKHPPFGKGWLRLKSNIMRTLLVLFCVLVAVCSTYMHSYRHNFPPHFTVANTDP
jgi:hypothetical protein